jgi:hypothetical protein
MIEKEERKNYESKTLLPEKKHAGDKHFQA